MLTYDQRLDIYVRQNGTELRLISPTPKSFYRRILTDRQRRRICKKSNVANKRGLYTYS